MPVAMILLMKLIVMFIIMEEIAQLLIINQEHAVLASAFLILECAILGRPAAILMDNMLLLEHHAQPLMENQALVLEAALFAHARLQRLPALFLTAGLWTMDAEQH